MDSLRHILGVFQSVASPVVVEDNPLKTPRGDPLRTVMPMLHGPAIQTPLTDLVGGLVSTQEGSTFCANIEMLMLNCLEQYGYNRGIKMCGGYIEDLQECRFNFMERQRVAVMREERKRQYIEGTLKERYEECPPHL